MKNLNLIIGKLFSGNNWLLTICFDPMSGTIMKGFILSSNQGSMESKHQKFQSNRKNNQKHKNHKNPHKHYKNKKSLHKNILRRKKIRINFWSLKQMRQNSHRPSTNLLLMI